MPATLRGTMEPGKPVTTQAILAALGLGIVPPALVLWALPAESELPVVEIWKPLDLPIAAVALALWLGAALFLRPPVLPRRFCLTLAFLLAAAATALSASVLPTTVSNDERAYLLQAEMFAAGRLTIVLNTKLETKRPTEKSTRAV